MNRFGAMNRTQRGEGDPVSRKKLFDSRPEGALSLLDTLTYDEKKADAYLDIAVLAPYQHGKSEFIFGTMRSLHGDFPRPNQVEGKEHDWQQRVAAAFGSVGSLDEKPTDVLKHYICFWDPLGGWNTGLRECAEVLWTSVLRSSPIVRRDWLLWLVLTVVFTPLCYFFVTTEILRPEFLIVWITLSFVGFAVSVALGVLYLPRCVEIVFWDIKGEDIEMGEDGEDGGKRDRGSDAASVIAAESRGNLVNGEKVSQTISPSSLSDKPGAPPDIGSTGGGKAGAATPQYSGLELFYTLDHLRAKRRAKTGRPHSLQAAIICNPLLLNDGSWRETTPPDQVFDRSQFHSVFDYSLRLWRFLTIHGSLLVAINHNDLVRRIRDGPRTQPGWVDVTKPDGKKLLVGGPSPMKPLCFPQLMSDIETFVKNCRSRKTHHSTPLKFLRYDVGRLIEVEVSSDTADELLTAKYSGLQDPPFGGRERRTVHTWLMSALWDMVYARTIVAGDETA